MRELHEGRSADSGGSLDGEKPEVKAADMRLPVTSSLCAYVMCYCVITASAYTSAGSLSLKQNGVYTKVITSGCTDCPLRTLATLVVELSYQRSEAGLRPRSLQRGFLQRQTGKAGKGVTALVMEKAKRSKGATN